MLVNIPHSELFTVNEVVSECIHYSFPQRTVNEWNN